EFFRADVTEAHGGIALLDGVPDGMHQVRLAHAHAAIKEKRVVGFGGLLGDGAGSGVRKFIGLADYEAVEGVAEVELMVAAFEIELGLLGTGNNGSGRNRLFLGADVLHFGVGSAHLVEDSLDDLAISAGEDLAENGAGNLDEKNVTFLAIQPGGLEPGGISVDADA